MSEPDRKSIRSEVDNARAVQQEWLGLRELTRYATVSDRTLRVWMHFPVDPLPAVQVRGKILVNRRIFDDWLNRHSLKPLGSVDIGDIVDGVLNGLTARDDGR